MRGLFIFIYCFVLGVSAQNTLLSGRVQTTSQSSVAGIHILNVSQKINETTRDDGSFEIEAVVGDTLVFSAIQFKVLNIRVTQKSITNKSLDVTLEQNINELPEAVIGFTLTGDLSKDMANSKANPTINFYNVGIKGYTGKRKTKVERVLQEASGLSPKAGGSLGGLGVSLSPIAVINAISGRTKQLKKHVAIKANEKLMYALKGRLSETFFKNNPLAEDLRNDFFYFCSEDETFEDRCNTSDFRALAFMEEKYLVYKNNLNSKE